MLIYSDSESKGRSSLAIDRRKNRLCNEQITRLTNPITTYYYLFSSTYSVSLSLSLFFLFLIGIPFLLPPNDNEFAVSEPPLDKWVVSAMGEPLFKQVWNVAPETVAVGAIEVSSLKFSRL